MTTQTLATLNPGEHGMISSVDNKSQAVKQRLMDMGLTPGTEVTVEKAAPLGDPIQLRVRGYSLSIRRSDAAQISIGAVSNIESNHISFKIIPKRTNTIHSTEPRIALVGNPNSGKTTLFNALTGSKQYVGNWPGVTVEKKEGKIKTKNHTMTIVDLPGIYSISPYSIEEKCARDHILSGEVDVIINILDATNLQRNLYLTIQLMELGVPMVLALNFMDAAKASGKIIDTERLSDELHIPVVPISAKNGKNLDKLLDTISKGTQSGASANIPSFRDSSQTARYKYISELNTKVVKDIKKRKQTISQCIDKVVTSKYLAIPLFLSLMLAMFSLTFGPIGSSLSDYLGGHIEALSLWLKAVLTTANVSGWLIQLITDGIISGVGGVLTFLPQITILFLFLSLLEDSGYMARAAFIMDRLLRCFGLSGKAFIPMIMGFGCSVPAIMGARTMESEKDRRLTIMLIPFMSCSAKLPVYGLLASAFFGNQSWLVVFSLYILGIVMAIISGMILKNTALSGETAPFVLELPPYRLPSLKNTLSHVWERVRGFLTKAGTLILLMSIVLWFLESFDTSLNIVSDRSQSILAAIGSFIAPAFAANGFGTWQAAVALLTGFVAKEAVVSSLSMFYGFSLTATGATVAAAMTGFTPLSAFSFLVFVLLYVPCVAAVSTMFKEMNNAKYAFISIFWQIFTAYALSMLVYQVGTLLGLG